MWEGDARAPLAIPAPPPPSSCRCGLLLLLLPLPFPSVRDHVQDVHGHAGGLHGCSWCDDCP
jgi:hypothetical protein